MLLIHWLALSYIYLIKYQFDAITTAQNTFNSWLPSNIRLIEQSSTFDVGSYLTVFYNSATVVT